MLRNKFLYYGQRLIEKGPFYLAPFSFIYAFIIFCRNELYNRGLLPVYRVNPTVVSVGNIVAGGSGKTPFVHLLAQQFFGKKIAILSRGYGEMPDEAILLARRLPHVQVCVGKDRVALAKQIEADLIILDDGFQHRRLHRDVDIVLGSRVGRYLPWGFLRDSPKRVEQADFVFKDELKLKVKRILDLKGNLIPSIQGWKVGIFCGIAHPENFRNTVEAMGAEVVAEQFFADHEMAPLNKLPKTDVLICTEKDFVKLPATNLPIYFLEMEMEFVGDPKCWEKMIDKISQKIDNRD